MKICLITAFPLSRGLLNEYGHHVAQELPKHSLLSVTLPVAVPTAFFGAAAPRGAAWM